MGRRRKKRRLIARRPKKTIPSVFQCPNCGKIAITVELNKPTTGGVKHAVVKCGNCGLYTEMNVPEIFQNVDVYGIFLDRFYSGTLKYSFITPAEEEKTEELA